MNTSYRFLTLIAAIVMATGLAVEASADIEAKNLANKAIQQAEFVPDGNNAAMSTNETEPNDDCATAEALLSPMVGAIDPFGDEDWYSFSANAGDCVTIGTDEHDGSSIDTQIYLYDAADCGDVNAWLTWDDDAGPGLFSLIQSYAIPASGTYYVRVKHYSQFLTGDYELTLETESCPTPPANDLCENAEAIACDRTVAGTTTLAGNDLDDVAGNCVPYIQGGPDVFYQVCVPNNYQITAIVTPVGFDPGLWFVTDCNDENSCIAGVDAGLTGAAESLSWLNSTGGTVCIYIVVDSYSIGHYGDFTLQTVCTSETAAESSNWGAVKELFR